LEATGMSGTVETYLRALRTLAPLVAESRDAFDRDRRITDGVFRALSAAGLFRLWLPRGLGGPELSPLDFMAVVEAAAALDGSVGWLVGNGGGMSRVGGYLAPSVAGDVFADPAAFVASATGAVGAAVPADGGYRLTGRWPFASGASHATHFMGLARPASPDGSEQPIICCYLDRRQVTVHDTWHVSGLRGTSSCDFEARDVLVPAERTHPFLSLTPTQPGLVYRLPPVSAFAWTVAVVPLGIARGAIEAFAELASRKGRQGAPALLRDRELVQAVFGRVQCLHRAARGLLLEAMTELTEAADVGGDRLVVARVDVRAAAAHAAESAGRIVDMLAAEAGAAAIFESCPIERAVRDVQAATKHIAMGPVGYVLAGRVGLGLDPGTPRF
jgi:alkylation response protein AidB-like acyl-CoA dehydrogenase